LFTTFIYIIYIFYCLSRHVCSSKLLRPS